MNIDDARRTSTDHEQNEVTEANHVLCTGELKKHSPVLLITVFISLLKFWKS